MGYPCKYLKVWVDYGGCVSCTNTKVPTYLGESKGEMRGFRDCRDGVGEEWSPCPHKELMTSDDSDPRLPEMRFKKT
jgi:hypothetical protein